MKIIKETETLVCRVCGETQRLCYFDQVNAKLKLFGVCFTCDFWWEKIEWECDVLNERKKVVRVDGVHYHIGDEPNEEQARRGFTLGFGGHSNYVIFNSGRRVASRNLWCQGKIPDRFRHILTDNARFVTKEEFEKDQ